MNNQVPVKRIQRLSLLSIGLALLITVVLLVGYHYIDARRKLLEEVHTQAAIIGANSTAAILFDDAKTASEIINAIRLTPRILSGALYRADGKMLASSSAGNTRSLPTLLADVDIAQDRSLLREEIRQENVNVGTVVLRISFDSLYWGLVEYVLGVLAIATIALALAYSLTYRLRKRMAQAEEQLEQLALYDQVTGLPNRRLFERELEKTLSRIQREPQNAALLFIDVDDFKKVNDSLGHAAGDQVLRMIAERLRKTVRAGDEIARLGGDEFAAVLFGIGAPDNAGKVAREMINAISAPFLTEPNATHVGLSIGIALIPADGDDPATLLRRADMAMYVVKTQGKSGFQFFSEGIDAKVRNDLALETGLRAALRGRDEELWVAYQPQRCAATQRLVGVEALVRWRRLDGSEIPTSEFVPIAEKTGLISELGDWVLDRVCRDLVAMGSNGVVLPKIAINISPRQLLRGSAVAENFRRTIMQYELDPSRFDFELTENALMGEGAAAVLDAFCDAGFSITIDDFGTGYSSLGYLKRFRVSKLKIDQRFVRGLPDNAEDMAIVSAVIQMAHALRISVVAEGVETLAQADFLVDQGCDSLQGYLFGRPMSPADLILYTRECKAAHEQLSLLI